MAFSVVFERSSRAVLYSLQLKGKSISLTLKEQTGSVGDASVYWIKNGLPQSEGNDGARFSLAHRDGDTLMIIHEVVFIWVTKTKDKIWNYAICKE